MSRARSVLAGTAGTLVAAALVVWAVAVWVDPGLHGATLAPILTEAGIDRAKLFPPGSCSADDWRTAWPARGTICSSEDQGLARKPPVARWEQL